MGDFAITVDNAPLLRFCSIVKRFPGVTALQGVRFDVRGGSCHAWIGENGAGKSTLGRILAGVHRPDEGGFEVDGRRRTFHSPLDARRVGIGIVHQELSFCPNLSVAENVCLASLPRRQRLVDHPAIFANAEQCLAEFAVDCDVREEMGRLTTGQAQLVQIATAIAIGVRVLILDEPTSSLSAADSEHFERLIGRLRQRGTTIIYISHRMEEIFRLCDTITVLRDGRHVATMPTAETNEDELVRMMIGRPMSKYCLSHIDRPLGPERLKVESLSSPPRFHDVHFSLRAGEVLGMAGLVGSGRSEVAMAIFGLDPLAKGRVSIDGRRVRIRCPRDAITNGLGLVGEDRKRQGIVPEMSCAENLTLAMLDCPGRRGFFGRLVRCPTCSRRSECLRCWDILRHGDERRIVSKYFQSLRVKAASPSAPIATLSGGNQQKLILARWLARRSQILLLDEPTRGVDVAAKADIHRLIEELAAASHAVLMISSELPEVLAVSHRVLVMRQGQVAGVVPRSEATPHKIMELMAGYNGAAPAPTTIIGGLTGAERLSTLQ
jgi:ABC-type sugar transport system ATPase subunit